MAIGNLGSIGVEIQKLIPNVPSALSGTNMDSVIYSELLYMQTYTGETIGSNSIAEKYQPAMIALAAAAVLGNMELQGVDASQISLGDFSISKGGMSNTTKSRDYFREQGMAKLREIGRTVRFTKANG